MASRETAEIVLWQVYYVWAEQTRPEPKHKFVAVAYVKKGYCLTFPINSRINDFIRTRSKLLVCEVELPKKNHDFLDYDSWLDCRETFTFPHAMLNDYRGEIHPSVLPHVYAAVKACPVLRRGHKRVILEEVE